MVKPYPTKMSCTEALALKVQTKMSDNSYQMIRNASLACHADIYPTLHNILKEKEQCYPKDLEYTETSAKCTVKEIAHHTLSRLLDLPECKKQLDELANESDAELNGFKDSAKQEWMDHPVSWCTNKSVMKMILMKLCITSNSPLISKGVP